MEGFEGHDLHGLPELGRPVIPTGVVTVFGTVIADAPVEDAGRTELALHKV
jgi:hypothetical protein